MKTILYICILLLYSSSFAQDPQLFEDTWYLQKLTINNITILPPNNNPEVTEHTFDEQESTFATGYCDFLGCEITFNNGINSFNIDGIVSFGPGCNHPDDVTFHSIYKDYLEEYTSFNPYTYVITNTNGIRFLEFTNANGNRALYANQLLAVHEHNLFYASLYPNPAGDYLMLSLSNMDNATVTIYNILGNKVMESSIIATSSELYIETLKAGVYLMNVVASDGQRQTLKFIKE